MVDTNVSYSSVRPFAYIFGNSALPTFSTRSQVPIATLFRNSARREDSCNVRSRLVALGCLHAARHRAHDGRNATDLLDWQYFTAGRWRARQNRFSDPQNRDSAYWPVYHPQKDG